MTSNDREYYSKRRAQCLARAENCVDPYIAKIHRALADHYATVLKTGNNSARDPRSVH